MRRKNLQLDEPSFDFVGQESDVISECENECIGRDGDGCPDIFDCRENLEVYSLND